MVFDFALRAAAREQEEYERQTLANRDRQQREEIARSLAEAFDRFAKSQRGLKNLATQVDGAVATFRNGSREVVVTVSGPTTFNVTQTVLMAYETKSPTTEEFVGETALMDALDGWATSKR